MKLTLPARISRSLSLRFKRIYRFWNSGSSSKTGPNWKIYRFIWFWNSRSAPKIWSYWWFSRFRYWISAWRSSGFEPISKCYCVFWNSWNGYELILCYFMIRPFQFYLTASNLFKKSYDRYWWYFPKKTFFQISVFYKLYFITFVNFFKYCPKLGSYEKLYNYNLPYSLENNAT